MLSRLLCLLRSLGVVRPLPEPMPEVYSYTVWNRHFCASPLGGGRWIVSQPQTGRGTADQVKERARLHARWGDAFQCIALGIEVDFPRN